MRPFPNLIAGLLLIAGFTAPPVQAAQSYNGCTGFIDSLPATISTPGTWCLRKDLSTSITNGTAITIATNNVTVDCNDFKVGGLGAGNGSYATGIAGGPRQNATVRNCNVRGFYTGLYLSGAGHLVEDNRFDQSLAYGIYVLGDNNRVRRNAVYDTGGYPGSYASYGIHAEADVIDNTVAGVFATAAGGESKGIYVQGVGMEVRHNRIRGLVSNGGGARGIEVGNSTADSDITIADNRITATPPSTPGYGIYAHGTLDTFCTGNTVANFSGGIFNCQDAGGNASHN